MSKRLAYTSALLLAGLLAATPAGAVRDFTAKGESKGPDSSMSVYGSNHTVDNNSLKDFSGHDSESVSAVPEPAGWLLMLVGFGLLGAMSRRGNPHPMRDELTL